MRKKELLANIPDAMPEENAARICMADGQQVLMLLLPAWVVFRNGRDYHGLVHFLWRDGFLTYYGSGVWTRESLDWVYNTRARVTAIDFGTLSRETISAYMSRHWHREWWNPRGYMSEVDMAEDWIRQEKRDAAMLRKQERINKRMEVVPPLPEDFQEYCVKKLKEKEPKARNGYFKLWNLLDTNGAVERIFRLEMGPGTVPTMTEICRAFVGKPGGEWNEWYYGEYDGAIGSHQEFWDKKSQSVVNTLPRRHYIYDNLDELGLLKTQIESVRLLDGMADPAYVLRSAARYEEVEQLAKAGALRLAVEMSEWPNGTRDCLRKANKQQIRRVAKHGGGRMALRMLIEAPNITDENLKEICRIKAPEKVGLIRGACEDTGANVNHMMNLWRKTGGIKVAVIRKYKDYIDMAVKLGHDPSEEIFYRNKNWQQWHDRYVEEINREKERLDKVRRKEKWAKWEGIRKDFRLNCAMFSWEDDRYTIRPASSAEEINEEGRMQHHCVGATDTYKDKMTARESFIILMRKKEEPQVPYYTIETDGNKLLQWYGAYDRKPDKEVVERVLGEWMQEVRSRINRIKGAGDEAKAEAAGEALMPAAVPMLEQELTPATVPMLAPAM